MSSPTVPEGGGPVRARVPTIIVVDDEEAILSSLRSLFRRQGYTLHAFPRAAAALEFVRKMPVDLIVSDLRMPVMTGIEFLNQAAAVNPQAVRIILSGYEDKGVVMNALAKGLAQHYVLKPWDDYALKTLVAQSLKRLNDLRHQRLEGTLGSLDALPSPPQLH